MTLALLQVFPRPQPRPPRMAIRKVRGSAMIDEEETSVHARKAREAYEANKDELCAKMRAVKARKR